MKIDIDTIFYIVISILILIVTGLSRRKKKGTIPGQGSQNIPGQVPGRSPDVTSSSAEESISDPFERLEKLFLQPETVPTPESVTLEEIVDEEEAYFMEKEASSKAEPEKQKIPDKAKEQEIKPPRDEDKQYPDLNLFKDIDELKRAVIYAEILNRKEF
ncbi:MAG: hypothetical protein AMS27_00570 [Bacteroides sp. SM23_62_1]|nr:MAG: hypothetical protein AMS27_00570 [Bacteroides sp. SM23_62_1]